VTLPIGLDIGHLQKQLDDSLREITMLKSKKVMTEEAEKENMNLKV
jgi:myosin V